MTMGGYWARRQESGNRGMEIVGTIESSETRTIRQPGCLSKRNSPCATNVTGRQGGRGFLGGHRKLRSKSLILAMALRRAAPFNSSTSRVKVTSGNWA